MKKSCFPVFVYTDVFLLEGTDLAHCVYKSVIAKEAFSTQGSSCCLWQKQGLESKIKSDFEADLVLGELIQGASKMLVAGKG